MALKKEDKVRLEGIKKTFTMLVSNGIPEHQILDMMQPQIHEFEHITGSKVRVEFGEAPSLEVLDLSKDFVRVRFPNEDNRVLRTKVQGIPIDVKLFKEGDFEFSNDEVTSALRSLADEIDELSMPLNSLDACDVRNEKEKTGSNKDVDKDAGIEGQDQDEEAHYSENVNDSLSEEVLPEDDVNLPV